MFKKVLYANNLFFKTMCLHNNYLSQSLKLSLCYTFYNTNKQATDISVINKVNIARNKLDDDLSYKNNSYIDKKQSLIKSSYNLAPFVNKSETLTNLVKLGVNLSLIESDFITAEYLIKMDFKKDIQPYILFLHDQGIAASEMGKMITKNPAILRENMSLLKLRMDYLKSKGYNSESIIRIVSKLPSILTTSTIETDKCLGFIQNEFNLTGNETRLVTTKFPKIIVWHQPSIQENKLYLMDFLGFEKNEIKEILIKDPRLLISGRFAISQRFHYLHNTIGFSHKQLLYWPEVFRTRLHIIKQRHQFLKSLSRDRFDEMQENFICPKSLVVGSDIDFCLNVAKVPIERFNNFLKTL